MNICGSHPAPPEPPPCSPHSPCRLLTQRLEEQRAVEGEDDGSQILQADHGDVAVNPRDLWAAGISRRPAVISRPPLPSQLPHPDLALDLQDSDAPGFLPHLLHPALGQAQVCLEVMAGDGQAQPAEADDGPEARGVVGRVRQAGARGGGCQGDLRVQKPAVSQKGCLVGEVAAVGRMGWGGLLVLEEVDWCTCASVSPWSKDAGTQSDTYICTVCLPMGAWSRNSREMGLIHITTTRTGARKLTWSRTLQRSRHETPPYSLEPPVPPSLGGQGPVLTHTPNTLFPPPNLLAALQSRGGGERSQPPKCQHQPPRLLSHMQISPNWVRGLSAAIRRASRCVWARRSPGKVRQAPKKEHRATSPSLKASLARGNLRRKKVARGRTGRPHPR